MGLWSIEVCILRLNILLTNSSHRVCCSLLILRMFCTWVYLLASLVPSVLKPLSSEMLTSCLSYVVKSCNPSMSYRLPIDDGITMKCRQALWVQSPVWYCIKMVFTRLSFWNWTWWELHKLITRSGGLCRDARMIVQWSELNHTIPVTSEAMQMLLYFQW